MILQLEDSTIDENGIGGPQVDIGISSSLPNVSPATFLNLYPSP